MKVLLAVDGSECSGKAVEEVASRPWKKGTKLKIFSVATSRYPVWFVDPAFAVLAAHMTEVHEHHKILDKLVEDVKESISETEHGKELEIETEVVDGYPKEEIVREAKDWDADLIVIGSHGYGNFKRFLLGSVAQAVVAHAPCSVEVYREKGQQ
ncbi:MAG: universal stress protein [Acidobacteriota bacterium]|nr:MAG: universal stress protein [Acidobacteriota bacterium]